jgi:hypothetical protein
MRHRKLAAIAKTQRKLDAPLHLYEEGEISPGCEDHRLQVKAVGGTIRNGEG